MKVRWGKNDLKTWTKRKGKNHNVPIYKCCYCLTIVLHLTFVLFLISCSPWTQHCLPHTTLPLWMQYPPCTLAFSAPRFQLASFLLSSAQDKFKCTPRERHSPGDTLEEGRSLSLAWPVLHCPRDTAVWAFPLLQ